MALAFDFEAPEGVAATDAAHRAGLNYVSDSEPGYRRRRVGKSFAYYRPDGGLERDREIVARIRKLAVPPAWTDVWICPDPHGHIQASARDAKGRKQYRYHAEWRATRDEVKFHRMPWFGSVLPGLREKIREDLGARDSHTRVCAAVAALLDLGALRVGSSTHYEGAGAATLKKRNVTVDGEKIRLRFRGKGGVAQDVSLRDRRLARVVRAMTTLPGQHLFKVEACDGGVRPISSTEVNAYLREVAGAHLTAKEFRTWAAGAAAVGALLDAASEPTVKAVLEAASRRLGNTPAICRKSYVHPEVIALALDRRRPDPAPVREGLDAAESTFLAVIEEAG